MADELAERRDAGSGRAAAWLATASIVAWFVIFTVLKPTWVADEQRHFLAIQWLSEGRPLPDGFLPMLPTWHLLAAGIGKVFGTSLFVMRALNAVLAVLCVWLFRATVRLWRPASGGSAVLLFAWNPLLFPYTVMAYTEAASILALVGAVYLHLRGRLLLSAAALLVACLVRQSSVVWVAFLATWVVIETWRAGPARHARPFGARVRWVLRRAVPRLCGHAVLIAAAGFFIVNPSFAAGLETANRAAVNVAQFYLFGLVVAVLWAPLWIQQLWRDWAGRLEPAFARGWVCALVLAAIGLLEMSFDNPHPWNGDPEYLRNRPLMLMMVSRPARLLTAGVLVAVIAAAAGLVAAQRQRTAVALAWLFSFLFVSPHWLVDPRYYILPTVFVNLFSSYEPGQARRLVAWYLGLTILLTGYVAVCGSPHGGVP